MSLQPQFIDNLTMLLEKVGANEPTPEITEEIISEFKESCGHLLRKMAQGRTEEDFRLRMSNIGKDVRQLWLEKEYGRTDLPPNVVLKMKFGDIIEALMKALLLASNPDMNTKAAYITLDVNGNEIKGEYDLKIDGKVQDIKSCSTYAYDNKFRDAATVIKEDSFGYAGQLIGYAIADNSKVGGWIVVCKETGDYKHVDASSLNTLGTYQQTLKDFSYKIDVLEGKEPVPQCEGVVPEVFNRKPTGRMTLGSQCTYCNHKHKCHPSLTYEPVAASNAKDKPWRYYVEG